MMLGDLYSSSASHYEHTQGFNFQLDFIIVISVVIITIIRSRIISRIFQNFHSWLAVIRLVVWRWSNRALNVERRLNYIRIIRFAFRTRPMEAFTVSCYFIVVYIYIYLYFGICIVLLLISRRANSQRSGRNHRRSISKFAFRDSMLAKFSIICSGFVAKPYKLLIEFSRHSNNWKKQLIRIFRIIIEC